MKELIIIIFLNTLLNIVVLKWNNYLLNLIVVW